MSTLVDLKRGESTLIRTIDATSRAIDGVGTATLDEALERLEHAAVEARVRLDAAMSRMRDIVGTLAKAVSGHSAAVVNDLVDSSEANPAHTWRVEIAVSHPAEQSPLGGLPAEYDAGDPEPAPVAPHDEPGVQGVQGDGHVPYSDEVIDLGKLSPVSETPVETPVEPAPEQPAEATPEQPAIQPDAAGETPDVGKNGTSESVKVPIEKKAKPGLKGKRKRNR